MAKVIKQEGEEKYVQDIFLNMKEYAKLAEKQKDGEDFRFSTFISIYDKSGKIELPYFLSREEYDTGAIIGVPYIHLGVTYPGGKEYLQKVRQILDEAEIAIEFIEGKCNRCNQEKTLTETCETCGMEFCPKCIIIKDLEDEHNTCINCIAETET